MKKFFTLFVLNAIAAVAMAMGDHLPDTGSTRLFDNPERVTIRGYDGDAMEPFISRDGRYLLFNNNNDPAKKTDLHWATRIDDLTFEYKGKLDGANTGNALDGVASMDRQLTLYFVTLRSYETSLSTIYRGVFANGKVSKVDIVPGISLKEMGMVNFDAEISPDGNTLYFADGRFAGGGLPKTADIVMAERAGNGFHRRADSEKIMQNVNSAVLEYAPCISADGLMLLFTRLRNGLGAEPSIYMAQRGSTSESFGQPLKLTAIEGYVEAATLSPDEKSLYYHRRDGGKFVLYRVTRQ
jgi:WD40-like Beta Propeller Repeat